MIQLNKVSTDKIIFILLMAMAPLGQISIDFYSTSIPAITNFFNTTPDITKFIITLYLFGYGLGQIIYGTLADSIENKDLLKISFFIYIATTFFIPLSTSIFTIIPLRFIQGLSAAGISVMVKTIAVNMYRDDKLTKVISFMSITWSISPILAPVVGGYIQTYCGWKGCFYFMAIFVSILFILCNFFIKKTDKKIVTLHFIEIVRRNLTILKSVYFWRNIFLINLSLICLLSFITQTPTVFQKNYMLTPIQNGYVVLIISFIFLLGTRFSHTLKNYSKRNTIIINFKIVIMALISAAFLFIQFNDQKTIYLFIFLSGIVMFISGILFPISLSKCLQKFISQAGAASGLIGFITLITPALIFFMISTMHLKDELSFPIIMLLSSVLTFFGFNAVNRMCL